MDKIINIEEASKISAKQKSLNRKIVLVGGCFDILHKGHLMFLEEAAKIGDLLFVLLESDENVKTRKGESRPINSRIERASALANLPYVDYVISLFGVTKDEDYDKLIVQISPDIVALTKGDAQIEKREQQCQLIGAKLIEVSKLDTPSTTDLVKLIN